MIASHQHAFQVLGWLYAAVRDLVGVRENWRNPPDERRRTVATETKTETARGWPQRCHRPDSQPICPAVPGVRGGRRPSRSDALAPLTLGTAGQTMKDRGGGMKVTGDGDPLPAKSGQDRRRGGDQAHAPLMSFEPKRCL